MRSSHECIKKISGVILVVGAIGTIHVFAGRSKSNGVYMDM